MSNTSGGIGKKKDSENDKKEIEKSQKPKNVGSIQHPNKSINHNKTSSNYVESKIN